LLPLLLELEVIQLRLALLQNLTNTKKFRLALLQKLTNTYSSSDLHSSST
jgi:hypothetical protein